MIDKDTLIHRVSNPKKAQVNAKKYLGNSAKLFISSREHKKYSILNPKTNKYIHFGNINYEDYTKHKDKSRRDKYHKRFAGLKGDFKDDPYSPYNLALNILW